MSIQGEIAVLVVDDSRVSRTLLIGLLRNRCQDLVIHEAADGSTAVTLAGQLRPKLVVLDVNMPGISGLDAAAQILQAQPGTRVAMLTANHQAATQRRAAEQGVAIFRKPISGEVADQILDLTGALA